jgi:hypothetical protein
MVSVSSIGRRTDDETLSSFRTLTLGALSARGLVFQLIQVLTELLGFRLKVGDCGAPRAEQSGWREITTWVLCAILHELY